MDIDIRKSNGYWNKKDFCKNEALKYNSKAHFHKNSSSAYNSARRNNWLDEICSHMTGGHKSCNYWTFEKCKDEALKYEYKADFRKKSGSAYVIAKNKGWLKSISTHFKKVKNTDGYWNNKELCMETAKLFDNRTEFNEKSKGCFDACKRYGWLEEAYSHMKIKGSMYLRFVYVFEFEDNHAYVGLTFNMEKRIWQHLNRKKDGRTSVIFDHIKSNTNVKYTITKITENPINVQDAQILEDKIKNEYRDKGWIILNKGKTGKGSGSVGGNVIRWNYGECKKVASQCKNRTELQNKYGGAYGASRANGWIEEFFPIFPSPVYRIIQMDIIGNYIKEYSSISEACKLLQLSKSQISMVCNGKRKTTGGFKFKWI